MLYIKHRKPLILYYLGFAVSLTTMLAGVSIGHYGRLAGLSLQEFSLWVGAIGSNVFIFVIPPLTHGMFGLPFKRGRWIGFGIFDGLVALASIAYLMGLRHDWILIALQCVLFSALLYGIVVGIIRLRSVGGKEIQRFVLTSFITAAIFFPLMAADSILGKLPFLPYDLSLPIFLLVVFLEIIVFSFLYLDQPPFSLKNRLTPYCVDRLKLTDREKEIVECLLEGRTNKEMSEKLFISFKTVENHLYNIYQKASVKNRLQLINLIHANSAP